MITAAILTHNDENRIERCIKLLNFCDEIVIMDDKSTDNTVQIAKKYTSNITQHPLNEDYAAQRNRLLEKSTQEWVLFIDPDEQVTTELANEIKGILKQPKYEVYYLKRQDFFWGKLVSHGEVSTAATKGYIRLVKKGSGTWKGKVHETFVTSKKAGELKHPLLHSPHQSVSEFIEKVNKYSTLRAKELLEKGQQESIVEVMFLPAAKFFYTFFMKQGFKDGVPGFVYSFLMSFHSFLVRAKLYQYTNIK